MYKKILVYNLQDYIRISKVLETYLNLKMMERNLQQDKLWQIKIQYRKWLECYVEKNKKIKTFKTK